MVTELRESCAALTTETRADVINRRTARVAELRRRLDCYRGLLGGYTGSIDAAINDTERDLLARIAQPAAQFRGARIDPHGQHARQRHGERR